LRSTWLRSTLIVDGFRCVKKWGVWLGLGANGLPGFAKNVPLTSTF
jgi:hypothetical protein